MQANPRRRRFLPLAFLFVAGLISGFAATGGDTSAKGGSQPVSCGPASTLEASPVSGLATTPPADPPTLDGESTSVTVGYVPISIYAPVFVAAEKGYFTAEGLDVTLEPLAGGGDLVALTASGQLQVAATGAGPAFWNGAASGLPVTVIAPGHREGIPVATPLMISTEACESGEIRSVADLAGKRVAVNAPGATEYWLARALGTADLTLDDVQLQTLPFPEAVAALGSGALDASMIGEPLATRAERDGIAVRLATDFPVQDAQPTLLIANTDFVTENPDAAQGFVTAYLRASRDLSGSGFRDPANLQIIEKYTDVPAALVGAAVPPVYAVDGVLDPAALGVLQTFFRERDQLEYDDDLDPTTLIETRFVEAAVAELGPYEGP